MRHIGAEVISELTCYSRLARELQAAGGYANSVLANTVHTLVFYRISQWLVRKPSEWRAVKEFVSTVPITRVEVRTELLRYIDDDPLLLAERKDVEGLATPNLYETADKLGIDPGIVLGASKETSSGRGLLDFPNSFALVCRLTYTDMWYRMCLPAFLEFLEKGGTLDELDPKDIRRFETRIRAFGAKYKFSSLAIRRLEQFHL
jgi:hypothetical protein